MTENQLVDKRKNGKVNDWQGKKLGSLHYFNLLEELEYLKAKNVKVCADILTFKETEEGLLKLKQAWFCKSRLCPLCNWRKSMKHSNQVIQVVDKAMQEYPKGRFLFWTLTTKNVFDGVELNEELSKMNRAFNLMMKYKKVEQNMLGYLKATEVTVNKVDGSYNQHFHVLVFVRANYFDGKENYISQEQLTEFWKKSLKIDYTPIVNIKAVKPKKKTENIKGAVYETAKYPVKSVDYMTDDHKKNLKVVDDLEKGLKRKRLISYGGLFKKIRNELKLTDVEESDLLKLNSTEDDEIEIGNDIVAYWNWHRKNYFLKN